MGILLEKSDDQIEKNGSLKVSEISNSLQENLMFLVNFHKGNVTCAKRNEKYENSAVLIDYQRDSACDDDIIDFFIKRG